MSCISSFVRYLCVGLVLAAGSFSLYAQDEVTPNDLEQGLAEEFALDSLEQIDQTAVQAASEEANPFGFRAMIEHGDLVSKGTLAILVIMSLATWYILIVKLFEQSRLKADAKRTERNFWQAGDVRQGMSALKEGGPFWYIVERGVSADAHHKGSMTEQVDRSTWIAMSINRAVDAINGNLSSGLAVLATVGSTAPFVGLFGTVWGILNALTKIGASGQASIDTVAGPVGEALIMTAIGLAVAVPAVLGYNWLVRRNKGAMEVVRNFSADLHAVLLSGSRVGQ